MTLCPVCRTNPVGTPSWTFTDTSVEIDACAYCQESGIQSITFKVSALVEINDTVASRFQDGLVTFN